MAKWMIMDLNIGFDEDNIESECLSGLLLRGLYVLI